ncbi:hypothetical protein EAO18_22875 [Klebsiella pneumoniae]|nr:hypothetical protein EAO18_22875 [Klebsiella pneumoniae]
MAGAGSGTPPARCVFPLTLTTGAAPPFPSPFGRGPWGNASPFFESHHNHRTPLFPFSPRWLN